MTQRWIVCCSAVLLLLLASCNKQNNPPDGSTSAPAANASSEQDPLAFDTVDEQPQVVSRVNPVYPPEDKEKGAEGMVVVKFIVASDGSVQKAAIARIEGATSGMEAAALTAIKQWKFSPAMKEGRPAAVWVSVPFKFKLADKPAGSVGTSLKNDADPKYRAGYIAGRKAAVTVLERRAAEARIAGKPDTALEKEIEQEKSEIKKLEEAGK